MAAERQADGSSRRGPGAFFGLVFLLLLACAVFTALGIWQVQRLSWKLDLIDRVERRVHAAPSPAPGPAQWPSVTAESDEYRRVRVSGVFEQAKPALTQAVTDLGAGYWVLSPFRTSEGFTVLVNRGFVPSGWRGDLDGPDGETSVTGLLRISEPKGGFLRSNDPAADRWFSRDVQAIAAARGLKDVAPYFIDADAGGDRPGGPKGGLTVVAFHNNHLVYALTWFSLALMAAGAGAYMMRRELRLRRGR